MRITVGQLRALLRETIDLVDVETGQVLDTENDDMVRDLMKRLGIEPQEISSDGPDDETWHVSGEDFWKLSDEVYGKRRERKRAKDDEEGWKQDLRWRAEDRLWDQKLAAKEQEQEDALDHLKDSAKTAGMEYKADNPDASPEGVARDLAVTMKHAYPDLWKLALEAVPTDPDDWSPEFILVDLLADYVAEGMVSGE